MKTQESAHINFPHAIYRKKLSIKCVRCGRTFERGFILRCPDCNSLVDPVYDIRFYKDLESRNSMMRYFYLLPLTSTESICNLGEGSTRCIHAAKLGEVLGIESLFLKDETGNPTGTTKDRMAACVVSYFLEHGISEFVVNSTGNSSTSFAYAAQYVNQMKIHIFCSRPFIHRLEYTDQPNIKVYEVNGDFVKAGVAARDFAEKNSIAFEGGFFNLARREGLKLAYLEAFDQLKLCPSIEPDVVVQAVSSGMGMYGAYRGALEFMQIGKMKKCPRFVCVQQESCAPMYNAFKEGCEKIGTRHIIENPKGLAKAILRGNPTASYPYIRNLVMESNGDFVAPNTKEIAWAKKALIECEGIDACYSSATALAGAAALVREGRVRRNEVILVNITGHGRKDRIKQTRNGKPARDLQSGAIV